MIIEYITKSIAGVVGVSYFGNRYEVLFNDGVIRDATQSEILDATKAYRIESDRQECRRRLTEFYGDALEQVSRISGIYGETALSNHETGVQAAIDASNTARDLINAATTVAQVEAVTVAWPVLS